MVRCCMFVLCVSVLKCLDCLKYLFWIICFGYLFWILVHPKFWNFQSFESLIFLL